MISISRHQELSCCLVVVIRGGLAFGLCKLCAFPFIVLGLVNSVLVLVTILSTVFTSTEMIGLLVG